jgi:toxin FitB
VNLVDSSAWLEYFADGPNAGEFAAAVENVEGLVVPTIVLFEVFKLVAQQRGDGPASQVVAAMQQGSVVDLTAELALEAARESLALRLALANSIILTTARQLGATLWTQDADFEGMDGVVYLPPVTMS